MEKRGLALLSVWDRLPLAKLTFYSMMCLLWRDFPLPQLAV